MAPQQNSTLIHEHLEDCPSLWNIPEEIKRCSPILPPKNTKNLDNNNNCNNKNNYHQHEDVNRIPKWEEEQRFYYKNKHHRNGSYRSSHSRRSRSISLYGANSTVEPGHHSEITIWLNDEPRYVSGVTNKTTCNDIIKALIDDEISNGNYEYCQRLKDGAASRDYSDYVITECWRGIERSYDGDMAILPVWKAWSRIHNEIRLSLKHHKNIQDPTKALKTNTTLTSIRNYIYKLLSFGKNQKSKAKKSHKSIKCKDVEQVKQTKSNDLMLRLKPDTKFHRKIVREQESKDMENQIKSKMNNEKLYKLSEIRSSVRKRRSASRRKNKKHDVRRNNKNNDSEANNFLRKRKDSCIRGSIRDKLAQKNVEMNDLYEREYALTKELTNKCKMYKLHNELYTTCDNNFEMSVGKIQRNIEACAKEIIQTEHELLEVKNVIKNDISIINNLKRLTIDTDLNDCRVPNKSENVLSPQSDTKPTPSATIETTSSCEQMLFVDNIYEFCDNNASMLV